MSTQRFSRYLLVSSAILLILGTVPLAAEDVIAWNNLGMHCMDADYEVFSLLPPYNTIYAQVIDDGGELVSDPSGLSVTYEAVADPSGSRNTTSVGKTGFWQHVLELFGVDLSPDQGLAGFAMPGAAGQRMAMTWDPAQQWFVAEGIPITPYDDDGMVNPYPMMRVAVRNAQGQVLATTDIVLPVSDEMDCRACHASGSGPAAQPAAGWVQDANPEQDYRRNILRLHDQHEGGSALFSAALGAAGYAAGGLEATVLGGTSVLCARCHASNALPGTGIQDLPPLTRAVHHLHAGVIDPINGLSLDASENRSACYRCHPGAETRCLRGVMGAAVTADGSPAMHCQSCHGDMSRVGGDRDGWLDEPGCGSCHTGTATSNSGQIRYLSVFNSSGAERVPANRSFATNSNVPATGYSLYRFSYGHGGLACQACHGSTHAEYPSSHASDNLQSEHLQGSVGTLAECTSCHGGSPSTTTGGPHGLHPIGQSWVQRHQDVADDGGAAQCQSCHGTDYRGTVLSRVLNARTVSAFGSKTWWRGFQIGCYTCHNGPDSDDATSNHPPVVGNATATTSHGTPVSIGLSATDSDGDSLTLRIVTPPRHGTAGLSGHTATYRPETGFGGSDSFTFAAWDGKTSSNLGTVTLTVTAATLVVTTTASPVSGPAPLTVYFSSLVDGGVEPYGFDWSFGDGSVNATLPDPTHVYTTPGIYTATCTVSDAGDSSASSSLAITVTSSSIARRYLIPGVAHSPGTAGTLWRTDVAAVNPTLGEAEVALTFRSTGGTLDATATVPAGGTVVWTNVVEELLGAAAGDDLSGALEISSESSLLLTARTFNDTPQGTYGQALPALTMADALLPGEIGYLPQLRGTTEFRSNIGGVNLGSGAATIEVELRDGTGAQLGRTLRLTLPGGEWRQLNDVFTAANAGSQEVAFATVRLTTGEAVWVYGSLIDNRTGDPTTIRVAGDAAYGP